MKSILRPFLFLTPIVLASCGNLATQREILRRSQAEIAAREPWVEDAIILIDEKPNDLLQHTWKVKAGAFDMSDFPRYTGLNVIPGTERNLVFSRGGCLLSYSYSGSRCLYRSEPNFVELPAEPGK